MQFFHYTELDDKFFETHKVKLPDVSRIVNDVKKRGDKAIVEWSKKFGDGDIKELKVTAKEIQVAVEQTPDDVIEAIKISIDNVKKFAEKQFSVLKDVEIQLDDFSKIGHRVLPLERVGCYVPGGNYPLPSSAIMSVVPAKAAGVNEINVFSPKIQPATIAAAHLAGANKIYKIGGVQAVGAMAYGTETIDRVDKIVGPGNAYVTAAKKEIYGQCGIDFLAGPSEIMIIADNSSVAEYVAADILAQLEHDVSASALFVTDCERFAKKVIHECKEFTKTLKTKDIIQKAMQNVVIVFVDEIEQGVEIANKKAPEHLEICFKNAEKYADKFINYGSLFIGNYSAEVFGDYCSGTNHILPTNGSARFTGGLSVYDFVKIQTYQNISKQTLKNNLCQTATTLANAEGLMAHKLSANIRA